MLIDRRKIVESLAQEILRRAQLVLEYGAFLRTLFGINDWFVTLTFRDRHQDRESRPNTLQKYPPRVRLAKPQLRSTLCAPDPRIQHWEPDSKYRKEPGPPVRDAALREIEHWLFELGWEAAGRTRQEIFNFIASDRPHCERKDLARKVYRSCLCCALVQRPHLKHRYDEIRTVATRSIGWAIAEEFGRVGGRWHVHLLIKGAQHIRRKKWWKRAFIRFGRSRIEPIHG